VCCVARSSTKGVAVIFGAVSLLVLFIGCATKTEIEKNRPHSSQIGYLEGTPAQTDTAPPLTATQARVIVDRRLQLTYLEDGEAVSAVIQLPPVTALDPASTEPAHLTHEPTIIILDGNETPGPPIKGEYDLVMVQPPGAWQTLIYELERKITPEDPKRGIVLDVLREEEIFLYFDNKGELCSVPMVYKPPEKEPIGVVSLVSLLASAMDSVRQSLAQDDKVSRYLLFNTGDAATFGIPFVLMDLQEQEFFFLQQSPEQIEFSAQFPAGALKMISHTLSSQVRTLLGHPASSIGRLFTSLGTGVLDTVHPTPNWVNNQQPVPPVTQASDMETAAWEQKLDELTYSQQSYGWMRYLVDGEAFFPALIHAINSAQHSIRMRLYIFDNDDYALKIADLLKRRSKQVSVEILLDGLGTITGGMAQPAHTPEYFRERPASIVQYLRADSGIAVRTIPSFFLHGDHTKTIIIDGKTVFLGGMNIGREYRYEWHDLMVEVKGPVVEELNQAFSTAWAQAGVLGDLSLLFERPRQSENPRTKEDHPMRLLLTTPGDSQILRSQIAAMRHAQRRIWIENAYLSSDTILYELVKARRRGVDVRVILPYQSDTGVFDRSNVLAANTMLKHGVRVYLYPGMSHVKAAVYDSWSCLGSANFDRLSLRINRELNISTSHPAATLELVEKVFLPDFRRSVELTEPFPVRWSDYLMELIADQL